MWISLSLRKVPWLYPWQEWCGDGQIRGWCCHTSGLITASPKGTSVVLWVHQLLLVILLLALWLYSWELGLELWDRLKGLLKPSRNKEWFTSAPILLHPDPSLSFIIKLHASERGIGAVLLHDNLHSWCTFPPVQEPTNWKNWKILQHLSFQSPA